MRSMILKLVIALTLLSVSNAFAEVGKKEFESIEAVSKQVLSKYPKEEYIYVGIGRSPVPVMAYLQSENGTDVRNIPLSDFRYGVDGKAPLSSEKETLLFQHFDHFLPEFSQSSYNKKILVIDFTNTGQALAATELYLNKFLESKGVHSEAKSLGMSTAKGSELLESKFPKMDLYKFNFDGNDHFQPEKNDHLLFNMMYKMYLEDAEFDSFDINDPKPLNPPNPNYVKYVKEMKAAKIKHKLGLLDDEKASAVFHLLGDVLEGKTDRFGKTAERLIAMKSTLKDMKEFYAFSSAVKRAAFEFIDQNSLTSIENLVAQLNKNPTLTGLDQSRSCDDGIDALKAALALKPLPKLNLLTQ